MDVKRMQACPECGSDNVLYSDLTNSLVCKDCGVIFADSPVFEKERSTARAPATKVKGKFKTAKHKPAKPKRVKHGAKKPRPTKKKRR